MWRILFALFVAISFALSIMGQLDAGSSSVPLAEQENAVRDLIVRAVGVENADKFAVSLSTALLFRSYTLERGTETNATLAIRGSDGLSAAKGFHHYLKYYLQIDINWHNEHAISLPPSAAWPAVNERSTSGSIYLYYQNVCTWSYSFAWWGWSQWRRHIDWMALMGISLTIAPVQEQLWHDVYTAYGLTAVELNEHFAGPAFQSWQRMGNMRGWGGPLPPSYRRMQQVLQRRILDAQRALGMHVALPAFAGHVPRALQRLFPNVSLTSVDSWNRFPARYCCSLFLEPHEPLFQQIGERFLRAVRDAYGSDHLFFADPFNENQPRLAEATYLRRTAQHIYASMRGVDAQAVWLLQGWMFVKNVFWTDALRAAFLTAVPRGRLLVLDLQSEQFPQYERTHLYHGQPFIWCMLHNFGGTLGMHGSATIVNRRIGEAARLNGSSMIGVGVTPEGIGQNYVMYSLALERGWRGHSADDDFDLTAWFASHAHAAYGNSAESLRDCWLRLMDSVYDYSGMRRLRGRYTITRRPSLSLDTWTWYNAAQLPAAWSALLAAPVIDGAPNHVHAYTHDLVDLSRQCLQAIADRLYVNLMAAYRQRQAASVRYLAAQFRALLHDLDAVLSCHDDFLLGRWLAAAQHLAQTPAERTLYEMNARNQITAWGPGGQILDYATKQWAGLVADYYLPRWELFLRELQQSLHDQRPFNSRAFKRAVSDLENGFSLQRSSYPNTTSSDSAATLRVAQRLYNKWSERLGSPRFKRLAPLHVPLVK